MKDGMLTNADCEAAAARVALLITQDPMLRTTARIKLYGIPRGGVPAAYLVVRAMDGRGAITDTPADAHVLIDDIMDSGATRKRWLEAYPRRPFHVLFNAEPGRWLVFPWEQTSSASAEDIPLRLLQFVGEDVTREGLRETPQRFLKAWKHFTSGYGQDPAQLLKTFDDGAERYDEMVIVRDIPVYSQCEHHMVPFHGTAAVAYIPDGRVVGLSKINRLVDMYARRLQVQERMTTQIADAMERHLAPKGVGVVIRCRHMCVEARGIKHQGSGTVTSALRGVMREGAARAEFLQMTGA